LPEAALPGTQTALPGQSGRTSWSGKPHFLVEETALPGLKSRTSWYAYKEARISGFSRYTG